MVKLNEYNKVEWRDVVRKARPDWTDEQFEEAWLRAWRLAQVRASLWRYGTVVFH